MKNTRWILPIIVFSQFCCTSLWFAGNSIMGDLTRVFGIPSTELGAMISSVQFGFIVGTLLFAILTISDRFSPSKVFFTCALLGAGSNLAMISEENTITSLLSLRFLTGFFLAGIYPVGMKIASDYFQKGLGKSLGYLVGALVLGTAFPHLLASLPGSLPWKGVLITTSVLATIGGTILMLTVPDGPYRKAGASIKPSAFLHVFKEKKFRNASIGYFGHMWELYAFWAFVPVILESYNSLYLESQFNVPLLSFSIIAIGSISCIVGGYISEKVGTRKTAFYILLISGCCCVLSPLLFNYASPSGFVGFLMLWGVTVIADSPLFSTLVAQNAPTEIRGTALTIVNCIGFSITILSIQLLNYLHVTTQSTAIYLLLCIGPIVGLIASRKVHSNKN